jgi:hypothetical protein
MDRRKVLYDAYAEYKRGFKQLSELLRSKIPEGDTTLSDKQRNRIIYVVNTSQYFSDTLPHLKETLVQVS